MAVVKKIRPSWELAKKDEEGNMFFEHTDNHGPNSYRDTFTPEERELASKKVMALLKNRSKL